MEPPNHIPPLNLQREDLTRFFSPSKTGTKHDITTQSVESDPLFKKLATLILSLKMDHQSLRSINLIMGRQTVVFNRDTYTFDDQKKNEAVQSQSRCYYLPSNQKYLADLLPNSSARTFSGLREIHKKISTDLSETDLLNIHTIPNHSSYSSQIEELLLHLMLVKTELKQALKSKRGIQLIIDTTNPQNTREEIDDKTEQYERDSTDIINGFKTTYATLKSIIENYTELRSAFLHQQEETKEDEFGPIPVSPLAFCLSSEPSSPISSLPRSNLLSAEPSNEVVNTGPDTQLAYIFETSTTFTRHKGFEKLFGKEAVNEKTAATALVPSDGSGTPYEEKKLNPSKEVQATTSQLLNLSKKKTDSIIDLSNSLTTQLQQELYREIRKRLVAMEDTFFSPFNSQKKIDALPKEFETILGNLPPDFKAKIDNFLEDFKISLKDIKQLNPEQEKQLNEQLKRILFGLNDFASLPPKLQQTLKQESQRVLCLFHPKSYPKEALNEDINENLKEVIISLEDAAVKDWVIGKSQRGGRACFIKLSDTAFSTICY